MALIFKIRTFKIIYFINIGKTAFDKTMWIISALIASAYLVADR
jgi:hypothetical protein